MCGVAVKRMCLLAVKRMCLLAVKRMCLLAVKRMCLLAVKSNVCGFDVDCLCLQDKPVIAALLIGHGAEVSHRPSLCRPMTTYYLRTLHALAASCLPLGKMHQ